MERAARHRHGCPSGRWPERANRVGQRGLSVLRRRAPERVLTNGGVN
jgi:hypothetical protein